MYEKAILNRLCRSHIMTINGESTYLHTGRTFQHHIHVAVYIDGERRMGLHIQFN